MCPELAPSPRPNGTTDPYVPPEGDPQTAKYVLVGEAPGAEEARMRRPFVGRSGQLLEGLMQSAGVRREDCYITNLCKYRPIDNHMTDEIAAASMDSFITEMQGIPMGTPILALGRISRDALCPGATGDPVVTGRRWREAITGHQVLSTVHPAFVLRNLQQARMLYIDLQKLKRGAVHVDPPAIRVLRTWEEVADFADWLYNNQNGYVAFDLETDQIDFQRDRVLCMTITYAEGQCVIIPDGTIYSDPSVLVAPWITPKYVNPEVRSSLRTMFDYKNNIKWVAHNGQFDLRFMIGQLGVENARVDYDTLLAHYTLWEEKGTHGLKELGQEMLDLPDWESDLDQYTKRSGKYHNIPRDVLYRYSAMDTEVTYRLAHIFERMMREEGLFEKPFLFPIMTYVPMLSESEIKGFPIDAEHLRHVDEDMIRPALAAALVDLNTQALHAIRVKYPRYPPTDRVLLRILQHGLNPSSSQQMAMLIYDVMGLPPVEARTRSRGAHLGERSTAKEAQDKIVDNYRNAILSRMGPADAQRLKVDFDLRADEDIGKWSRGRTSDGAENLDKLVRWACGVAEEGAPAHVAGLPSWCTVDTFQFMRDMHQYRRISKMKNAYVDNLLGACGPDGRVHTRYHIHGTVTGRLSATDPAIQTIPRDDEVWGTAISNAFVAPEGCSLVYADYSQCELRIAADITGDPFLIAAYNKENPDIHTDVATAIYGPNFTQEQRNWYCKRAVYGWLYGGNVYEIARDALRFPEDMARKFATDWDTNFAVMAKWRDDQGRLALKTGVVESTFGRRRRFLVITNENKTDVIHAGQNMPMQSGAADVTLIAASRVVAKWAHEPRVYLAVAVHDSIIFIAPDELVGRVAADLNSIMVATAGEFFPSVPHQADVKVGRSWGAMEKYKNGH